MQDRLRDFEYLPQVARVNIMMRAVRRFAKNVMGDEATVQYSIQDEQEARTSFMQDEARRAHHNMLTDSYSTNEVVARDRRPWPV